MRQMVLEVSVSLIIGMALGYLYHHHMWLQLRGLARGRVPPLLRGFWFRYSMLVLLLVVIFVQMPEFRWGVTAGVLMGRPVYLYLHRRRIFKAENAG